MLSEPACCLQYFDTVFASLQIFLHLVQVTTRGRGARINIARPCRSPTLCFLCVCLQALDSPQLRMESERLDQTPLSLIKSYGSSPPQHQRLSQQLEHELLHADYEVDVIANIRLPHTELLLSQDQEEEQEGQHKGASADVNSPGVGGSSYVGVDKVPGRTRWEHVWCITPLPKHLHVHMTCPHDHFCHSGCSNKRSSQYPAKTGPAQPCRTGWSFLGQTVAGLSLLSQRSSFYSSPSLGQHSRRRDQQQCQQHQPRLLQAGRF